MKSALYLISSLAALAFAAANPGWSAETKPAAEVKPTADGSIDAGRVSSTEAAIFTAARSADDIISKALEDELLRSMRELKLSNRPKPYFVAYTAVDRETFGISGSFGALDQVSESRYRTLNADVRVGDYKLDSSGRRGLFSFFGGRHGSCSLDNDYDALRHELWLNTDYEYKRAIEGLENKKAILQQKKIEDLPDSLSKVEPTISMKPQAALKVGKDNWQVVVRDISTVFRSYPQVIDSTVMFNAQARTRWFANSEGSLNREGQQALYFGISANGQASDGMRVSDYDVITAADEQALPSKEQLAERARALAERVRELAAAKTMDDYRGPILFEKQAAAELFAQALAPRLVNRTETVSAFSRANRASEKPGRRILPTYISVIDDPLARDYNGKPLIGGYMVDDEGVKGQKVTLVENGILKTYLSGRTPGRDVKESNGHHIEGAVSPSQLFVVSSQTDHFDKLKEKLIAMGKDEGLEYVLIVRNIGSQLASMVTPGRMPFFFGGEDVHIHPPTLLYKVYVSDGHEELVRGAKFARLTHRLFRDIAAVGDDSAPYPVLFQFNYSHSPRSVVTPSVLISEVDIERESHETDAPMILKNAFFEDNKANTGRVPAGKPAETH